MMCNVQRASLNVMYQLHIFGIFGISLPDTARAGRADGNGERVEREREMERAFSIVVNPCKYQHHFFAGGMVFILLMLGQKITV